MTVDDNDDDNVDSNPGNSPGNGASPADANTLSANVTISPDITASALAAELRKMRDLVNLAYRNALLENKMPIYHPVMQALGIVAMQLEGSVQILDPPMVQGPGMGGPGMRQPMMMPPGGGRGRA